MNIFSHIRNIILKIIKNIYPEITSIKNLTLEFPKNSFYGDLSTNAAIILSKLTSQQPRFIADQISEVLKKYDFIKNVEIAGPGFINIILKKEFWYKFLKEVLKSQENYSKLNVGHGKKVNIEFVSANPTGPLHLGHVRGAIYGDALARLLTAAGFNVTKEYYTNDSGRQIDLLANSLFIRYQQELGEKIDMPKGVYPGNYLKNMAKELHKEYEKNILEYNDKKRKNFLKKYAVDKIMTTIKADLASINVVHDIFVSEQQLLNDGKVESAIKKLTKKGFTYKGILDAPKGKTPEDWEPVEQLLFKSTEFGDDVDRPIQRSDGTYTYFSTDIAYHKDKIDRGFNEMVLLLGADHEGYIKRMKAVVNALSDGKASIDVKISQMVNLLKEGKVVKMSKRSGNFVTLRENKRTI